MIINKMNKKGAGLRPFVINLVLVVLFSVFILYFVFGFIAVTNPSSQIIAQSNLNNTMNNLNSSLSNFSDVATDVYTKMGSSQPSATDYLFLIFQGAFEIPKAFLGFAFGAILNIVNLMFVSFGGGLLGGIMVLTIGVVSSILTITLVLYLIKTIRTGESDH